ncbi:MAG TPA: alpha-L-fucosidase [Bacteroidales bacterium]|nr:alpha-L-fucosidase [Bacteroidales bacterium]
MVKRFLFLLMVAVSGNLSGQTYSPSWESLDKRPVPAWFEDSKFGIFIHWGVYSVPAWGPTGDSVGVYDKYAEWYWNKLTNTGSKVNKNFTRYHFKTYGPNFRYQDFAPMFKAELFDPDQWAQLFRESGAKYVVLTSKHHEGFTLWPSAQSWNWNSVDVGPHRDLCGDLTASVKKAGLHMGFYYSLYEWYNPVYKNNPEAYVDEHMIPQMKDLVTRYTPDILWTDGEWDKPSKDWKSEQFLAWLFNESPVKENIVVNDRWGSETRSRHGGIFTTEYGLVGEKEGIGNAVPHPWEECRGIGTSFGYNRTEGLSDYSTTEQLVKLLVSTVSAGGNLLLDIGPAADGTIPVIMQQRLVDMGKWLATNGEAIYGTRAFIRSKEDESINAAANKSIFFTQKGQDVYMICTEWPSKPVVLTTSGIYGRATVTMQGSNKEVKASASGNKLTINPPALTPDDYQPAYVFRIKGLIK